MRIARRGERAGAAGRAGFPRSVILGVDGSPHSRRAAAFVARLTPPRGGRVTMVSVVEPVRAPSMPLVPAPVRSRLAADVAALDEKRLAGARRRAEAAARDLERAGWRTASCVPSGVPLVEILRRVGTERADLLVLGARGVGGLERLLLGSVTDGALKQSPVAVLIVR